MSDLMGVDSTRVVCPLFQTEEGGSIPTSTLQPDRIKGGYYIRPISTRKAEEVVIERHYLHRTAPCSQAFGMFSRDSILRGVVTYGTPSNRNLRTGVCGPDEAKNVIELTRLWIEDGTPKNAESFLIGFTIRKVEKEIIVSYADPAVGHLGVVYQATNWLYTGLSVKRSGNIVKSEMHSQSLFDSLGRIKRADPRQVSMFGTLRPERGYQVQKLKERFGDAVAIHQQARKHRYVYFNAAKTRRAELMAKLRYPVLPYPKRGECPFCNGEGYVVPMGAPGHRCYDCDGKGRK